MEVLGMKWIESWILTKAKENGLDVLGWRVWWPDNKEKLGAPGEGDTATFAILGLLVAMFICMNECSCYWILLTGLEKNNVAIVRGTTVYDCGGVLLYNGEGILLAKVTLKLILLSWTFRGEKNKKTSIIEICINKFVFVTVTKHSCLGKSIHIFPFLFFSDWSLLPTSASPCFSFLMSSFLSILSK